MSNAWILWIKVNTGIIICVTAPIPEQEGGVIVEFIFSFYIAVAAGVVCHYIIKWLDGDK